MAIIDKIKEALLAGVVDAEPPGPIADFIKLAVEPILASTGMTDDVLSKLSPEDATKIITDTTDTIKTMVIDLSMLHIDLLVGLVQIMIDNITVLRDNVSKEDDEADAAASEGTTLSSDT